MSSVACFVYSTPQNLMILNLLLDKQKHDILTAVPSIMRILLIFLLNDYLINQLLEENKERKRLIIDMSVSAL